VGEKKEENGEKEGTTEKKKGRKRMGKGVGLMHFFATLAKQKSAEIKLSYTSVRLNKLYFESVT